MGLLGGVLKLGKKLAGKGLALAKKSVLPKIIPGGPAVGIALKAGKRALRKHAKKIAIGGAAAAGAGGLAMSGRGPGGGGVMEAIMGEGGGAGRRRRRINPGNVRAMRRAVRRVEAGAKLYSRLFRISHGAIKGAPGVRVKRHRRAA